MQTVLSKWLQEWNDCSALIEHHFNWHAWQRTINSWVKHGSKLEFDWNTKFPHEQNDFVLSKAAWRKLPCFEPFGFRDFCEM